MRDSRLGLSMAASWSWGASAAVGIGILLARGAPSFWAWTLANVIAVPVFGLTYRRLPAVRNLIEARSVAVAMVVIQVFAYLMNLQAIYEATTGGVDIKAVALLSSTAGTMVAIAVGVGLSAFIYRRGLPGSIQTDRWQFGLQTGACVAIVAVALATGVTPELSPGGVNGSTDAGWALWAGLGLLSGPFLDAQHWQRMERADSARPALLAGVWFAGYMVAVFAVATVLSTGGVVVSALFAVVALAIASSTIDSAAAALQRLTDRRVALGIGVTATLSWPVVQSLGVVSLWTLYASGRVFVVGGMLAWVIFRSQETDQDDRRRPTVE